jgi:hypothetical protein
MNRQSPPGGHPPASAAARNQWMTVRVRVQHPLPQGDGDHGDGDATAANRPVRPGPDESGYGHGV